MNTPDAVAYELRTRNMLEYVKLRQHKGTGEIRADDKDRLDEIDKRLVSRDGKNPDYHRGYSDGYVAGYNAGQRFAEQDRGGTGEGSIYG